MKQQIGMSLIELMISMVIGLFLLAGVVTNFISTTSADKKRDAISEMDANAAAAFKVLRQAISHAGYRSIENTRLKDDEAFYTDTKNDVKETFCRDGVKRDFNKVKKSRATKDGSSKDTLTVISLADNPCLSGAGSSCVINPAALVYTDCTGGGYKLDTHTIACSTDPDHGMPDPTEAIIYNSFLLTKNTSSKDDRELYCMGNRANRMQVASDVETIQYLYGVQNDAGSITFRRAKDIEKDEQWPMVVSVQVGLLMRSSNQFILDEPNTKKTYNVLNQNIKIANKDLQRLFRIYTTTINLENRQNNALL